MQPNSVQVNGSSRVRLLMFTLLVELSSRLHAYKLLARKRGGYDQLRCEEQTNKQKHTHAYITYIHRLLYIHPSTHFTFRALL